MSKSKTIILTLTILFVVISGVGIWFYSTKDQREFSKVAYVEYCASCHGDGMSGARDGLDLFSTALIYGDDTESLINSIQTLPVHGDIAWVDDFPETGIKALALSISERRQQYPSISDSYQFSFSPKTIESTYHRFKVERFSELKHRPYSIAPMPDGRNLVSEKLRGLSVVDTAGNQSKLIEGTPEIFDKFFSADGAYVGWRHALEVALHPDYANNGWIYFSFADRCQLSCGSAIPQSMVKVVRGRIVENKWKDEETIWSVDKEHYTVVPDALAGGRLAFDKDNFLYVTVGGKSFYKNLHDMDTPYGKVHRVKDNGVVPNDNPFWLSENERDPSSTRNTVYSYGHRALQGLTEHPISGKIWSTEMGPRGGDEVNRIVKNGNFGWPLYTNGLDYDSTEIEIGADLGLDFPIEETVLPVVDFTPAPALSNLSFYHGEKFSDWHGDMLIGSLKAMSIYRLRITDGVLVEKETIATQIGRIRDIEIGADGLVYVAIEHGDNGSILRLVPI